MVGSHDSTVGKTLALHTTDPGSVPGFPGCPIALSEWP